MSTCDFKGKRVVVKVGSSLLVNQTRGRLHKAWLNALGDDIAALRADGCEVVVVSSGSIALGRAVLKLPQGALALPQKQAAASVGQPKLMAAWIKALERHKITASQMLLTHGDMQDGAAYENARHTLDALMQQQVVPVINENDTVATAEITLGDNDRLAARIAKMGHADTLVLLSDIDGLYTAAPQKDPNAQHIPVVDGITPAIKAMAGPAASEFSRGGMITKVEAAEIATGAGCAMVIANGRQQNPLRAIASGARCTWFLPQSDKPVSAKHLQLIAS